MPDFSYEKIPKRRYSVWINSRYRMALLSLGIYKPYEFLRRYECGVIDDVTRSKIVSAEVPAENGSLRLAVKAYHSRGLAGEVKDIFRDSRAVREFLFAGRLFARGLPVPEPVAALEQRRFRRLRECWLVSKEIVGATSCHELIDKQKIYQGWPVECRTRLVAKLGKTVGEAHLAGYSHGDLNMSHLVVSPSDPARWPAEGPDIFFIDFEGGKLMDGRIPEALALKDLARFMRSFVKFASDSECETFYDAYASVLGTKGKTPKEYSEAVRGKLGIKATCI